MDTFMSLFLVVVTSALINNVVLSQFLGLCPFLGVSKQLKTASGMGVAVMLVITVSSALCSLLYEFVLVPFELTYLNTIVFILVIAALVQMTEMVIKKFSKPLYESLGVFLPLITTNCAVLGVALTNVQNENDLLTSVLTGFGTALGFFIAIVLMSGIREKIAHNDIPKAFQGMPQALLAACLMSIAFYGFKVL